MTNLVNVLWHLKTSGEEKFNLECEPGHAEPQSQQQLEHSKDWSAHLQLMDSPCNHHIKPVMGLSCNADLYNRTLVWDSAMHITIL